MHLPWCKGSVHIPPLPPGRLAQTIHDAKLKRATRGVMKHSKMSVRGNTKHANFRISNISSYLSSTILGPERRRSSVQKGPGVPSARLEDVSEESCGWLW